MSIRDVVKKTARIFVEMEPDPKSPNSPVPGQPNDGHISDKSSGSGNPSAAPINLAAIYTQAGIPDAPLKAEEMCGMLSRLSPNLEPEIKRQMIREVLFTLGKSEGATMESVVLDASAKISALKAYVDKSEQQAAAWRATTQSEIDALQEEIKNKRKALDGSRQEQINLAQQCAAETKHLNDLLQFLRPYASAAKKVV